MSHLARVLNVLVRENVDKRTRKKDDEKGTDQEPDGRSEMRIVGLWTFGIG